MISTLFFEDLTTREQIHVVIALTFLALGIASIGLLFFSRIIKSGRQRKAQVYTEKIQEIVNNILWSEQGTSASNFRTKELKEIIRNSFFAKQVLIDYLLHVRKSFSGTSEEMLFQIYRELELYKLSLKKLNSFRWEVKAKGIRELTQLRYSNIDTITKYLNSSNSVLRNESRYAMMTINDQNPLFFLDDLKETLTPWMQINILNFLGRLDQKKVPKFSKWLNHTNDSVVVFSIKMVVWFMQIDSVNEIVQLLKHKNEEVVEEAVLALGNMEAYDQADALVQIVELYASNEKISRAIAKSLGKIGDAEQHANVLSGYLAHPSHQVRLESANALRKLGDVGVKRLLESVSSTDDIVLHTAEPLLR